MPDMKFNDSAPVQLLPIVTPAPATPSLGEWHGRGLCVGDDPDAFEITQPASPRAPADTSAGAPAFHGILHEERQVTCALLPE